MGPGKGLVQWGGDGTFTAPFWNAWHRLDLITFKISPEAALQIAEQNGGKNARPKSANQCDIDIFMPEENKNMWFVDYTYPTNFSMVIDPHNGDYKILPTPRR